MWLDLSLMMTGLHIFCRIYEDRPVSTSITNPFNGLFSRTTWVSWHQKGKPFWITGARDDGLAVALAGPYANHLHLAPDG